MPSTKDISSTERLLNLIRNKERKVEESNVDNVPTPLKSRTGKGLFSNKIRSISVGIEIAPEELRLVKVKHLAYGRWELVDCRRVPIIPNMSRDTKEFSTFLRSQLEKFCGPRRDLDIWSLIPSDKVALENIRIPKVGKKQISNAVYWTVKRSAPFDEKETILEFEIQGEVVEDNATKLEVSVCTASRQEVEEMEALFGGIGFPLKGLTATPFALQSLFRSGWMHTPERFATLYIGDDSSRIDVFSKGNLVMTRAIRAGISTMAETLLEEYTTSSLLNHSWTNIESPDNDTAPMDIEDAKDLVFSLGFDSPPPYGTADRFGLRKDEIFEMLSPSVERMVRQVERTIEHYTVILGNEGIESIYLFSDGGVYRPFVEYVGSQLRLESFIMDPIRPDNAFAGVVAANTSISQRAPLISALGIALSNMSRTPNLIFTYNNKEKLINIKRVNRVILSSFATAALIMTVILFLLMNVVEKKDGALAKLEIKLKQDTQTIEDASRTMVSEIGANRIIMTGFKERYWGLAVVGELSRLTPEGVSLLSVKASIPKDNTAVKEEKNGSATISGIVTGSADSFESMLARYVIAIKDSPIFNRVVIERNSRGAFQDKETLNFSIKVYFS